MEGKFTLTWDKDFTADGYIITYQNKNKFTELVRVENVDITTIVVPNIKKGAENHIRVSFYQKKNNNYCIYKEEDYYCFAAAKKLIVYRFPIPKLEKAERIKNSITIKWEKVSDEVMYVVARKVPGGTWKRIGMTSKNVYVDREIDVSKKYIYTVRCVSDDGKTNLSSCSYKGICA